MKAVILAGGLGTRMGHEASSVPKPMVKVGGFPVLWHIMKILHSQGVKEFVICAGHKGDIIRDYFIQYGAYRSNLKISYSENGTDVSLSPPEPLEDWVVHIIETGELTQTGGRILAAKEALGGGEFIITYGDGIANVDIARVAKTHRDNGSVLTLSTAKPRNRFGVLEVKEDGIVSSFEEKPQGKELINIGYMVANSDLFAYLAPNSVFEAEPMRALMSAGLLSAVPHTGFWQPMDTPSELESLNKLWASGSAPWVNWI